MGRAGVSRTNIPFFLPPYTLVSLFFISFFFSFSFFLRHPCRRCRFPSSPDLEQIRGDSIRRISTSRPVPLRVNNCILLQKFLFFFFFSDRTKNIEATQKRLPASKHCSSKLFSYSKEPYSGVFGSSFLDRTRPPLPPPSSKSW